MNRSGTAYIVVKPGRYGALVVDKATNKKPRVTPEGSIVLAVRIVVPDAVFQPIEPEATITVPAELIQRPVIVEAVDPA